MSLVGTLKILESEKAALVARVGELETSLAVSVADYAKSAATMKAEHSAAIAAIEADANAAKALCATAIAERDAATIAAVAAKAEADKSAAVIASLKSKLANPAYTDANTEGAMPLPAGAHADGVDGDLWAQYDSLAGDARAQREFWIKNRSQMSK